jgi:hypothetical protein
MLNADRMREANAILENIINPSKENQDDRKNRERKVLEHFDPNIWNIYVEGNMEIKMESDFERFLVALEESGFKDMDNCSIGKFYSILEYLDEKKKAHGNRGGNN